MNSFDNLDPRDFILIKGAKMHNLKGIDVAFERNKLTVVTGLSGSGKSTLVFDTLYAEGQRRYVESLSAYARQFMVRMKKPEVDYIKGISPAIAIEQRVSGRNPRSTVGTSTEIYDYLKLLFARIGKTVSPESGLLVKKHSISDVVELVVKLEKGTSLYILSPLKKHENRTLLEELKVVLQKGFARVLINNEIYKTEEIIADESQLKNLQSETVNIVIDRLIFNEENEETLFRLSDSIQTAFYEGFGHCAIFANNEIFHFSDLFEENNVLFEEPSVNLFTFSNPYGACKRCEGFGSVIDIDENLVIPDKSMSLFSGCIAPWRSEKFSEFNQEFIKASFKYDFPIHRSYQDLSEEEKHLIWFGNDQIKGLWDFFKMIEEQTYKIQYRVLLARYKGRTTCPECKGTRLRKDASFVKLIDVETQQKSSIIDLVLLSIDKLLAYFKALKLGDSDKTISKRLLIEITNRLSFMCDVGLSYLTLNRLSNSLSGGESQRIKLSTNLGSSLVGSMYILDEPSIGLHPRDSSRLIGVLKNLRDKGNTVIVVEHEEEVINAADCIVDIGPMAGSQGGELVFQGSYSEFITQNNTITSKYLTGTNQIEIPKTRRTWKANIEITEVSEHNLQNVSVKIPLNILTVVTGVSGSGKTTLIKKVLFPALNRQISGAGEKPGAYENLKGDLRDIELVEMIDQNPIGKSSRSNPVTYTKAFDIIRDIFADQPQSKANGYKPGYFSFNVEGGRCEVCQGEGVMNIDMQFLADVQLECESCLGKRYKEDVLEITYNGKNIADILALTVSEALEFFANHTNIYNKLEPLEKVGLGYIKLGQASSTLSGGEAQRLKLGLYLTKGINHPKTLFIFDEPTTGLHFYDIQKLLIAFQSLIALNHTVLIIEHNMEIIKCADWIIDLGPEGGEKGGKILFEGTPEDLINVPESYTGIYLKEKLKG